MVDNPVKAKYLHYKTNGMRISVTLFMLLIAGTAYCQNMAVVDSVKGYYNIETLNGVPRTFALYEVYVSDTAQFDSFQLKLGNNLTANNIVDSVFTADPQLFELDLVSHRFFYPLRVGGFSSIPPYGSVCLQSGSNCISAAKTFAFVN